MFPKHSEMLMLNRLNPNAVVLAILCIACTQMFAQKKTNKTSSPVVNSFDALVLATVGSEKVMYADVERAFQKNMTRRDTRMSQVPKDTAMDFLRLYTNYRLKVASAKERGMHKDSAVMADIENNRRLLSETFYFDKVVADARVTELAKRRTQELQIGIILCAIQNTETKLWDTVGSKRKAEDIIKQLSNGGDFQKIAREQSDDKETGSNGGMLPWISGGSIIKAVEDEAYSLPVGKHSAKPVDSRFGFFIVKVFNQVPRTSVKFRHILLQAKDGRDSLATMALADSLVKLLRSPKAKQRELLKSRGITTEGDAFTEVAKKYSNDEASAEKGGYLGSYYSRSGGLEANGTRLLAEFEHGVYGLKDGEISDKVKTIFGWHIIIRDSTKIPNELVERDVAKRTYRRLYFEEDKRAVYDSLKMAYGYQWDAATFKAFMNTIDTTKNTQDTAWWKVVPTDLATRSIFNSPKKKLTVNDFTDSLRRRMDMRGYTLNRSGMERAINKLYDAEVLDQATSVLENKYPDFAALMQEFYDGILLFKVEEQEVWSKLKFDTVDAKVFYESTKSRWISEPKYRYSEIYVLQDSILNEVQRRLKAGESFESVAAAYTQRDGARDKNGSMGAQSPRTSKIAHVIESERPSIGSVSAPISIDKGHSVYRFDGPEAPHVKSFEEALPELAPAYQDALQKRLTEQWLSDVRKRNPVVMNEANIQTIWGK